MIGTLIISNICFVLLLKDVPTWLAVVLGVAYAICTGVSLILWEETKDKIKRIENHIKNKRNGEQK